MKMLIPGVLLATATLTTSLFAAPAAHAQEQSCPPGMAIDSQGSGEVNGPGPCVRIQRNDVLIGGHVLGRDPDPFIRGQIRREKESGD
jgi:hypothetical protein